MMELMGGLLGAGGGIAGALIGAEESAQTRDMNWAINIMNFQQRERERNEAIAMANKLRAEQKLGSTDIRGTRVKFVPGQGWVTTGSPEVLEMMKLQDAEQRKQLTEDLPMRRKVMQRNYARGLEDEGIADMYRRQLYNTAPARSDDALASDLYRAQAMGIREATQDAGRRAYTQLYRTSSNSRAGDVAGALAREGNRAYAQAALQSKLMSRGQGQKEVDARRNQLSNLYNLFATRASQLPEVNYRPQSIDNSGQLDSATKGLLTAGGLATQTAGAKGGTLDYISPDYGMANAVGGGASALASAFRAAGAKGGGGGQGGVSGFGGTGGSSDDDYYQGGQGDWSTGQ